MAVVNLVWKPSWCSSASPTVLLVKKKDSLDNKKKLGCSLHTLVCRRLCECLSVSGECLCVSTHVLTVCANEREAGDYAFLSQGTGAFSQELQCMSWRGVMCTLWPQLLGVPVACLKPFPSFVVHLRASAVMWMWRTEAICMFLQHVRRENNLWVYWQVFFSTLNQTLTPPPMPLPLTHISHAPNWPPKQQTSREHQAHF